MTKSKQVTNTQKSEISASTFSILALNKHKGSTVKEVEEFFHQMNLPPLSKEGKQGLLNTINHDLVHSFDVDIGGCQFRIVGE